jgi:hypothetical protein
VFTGPCMSIHTLFHREVEVAPLAGRLPRGRRHQPRSSVDTTYRVLQLQMPRTTCTIGRSTLVGNSVRKSNGSPRIEQISSTYSVSEYLSCISIMLNKSSLTPLPNLFREESRDLTFVLFTQQQHGGCQGPLRSGQIDRANDY